MLRWPAAPPRDLVQRAPAIAMFIALGACAQVPARAAQPAVLEAGDEFSHAVLAATLQKVLGRPVTLAPDALTRESSLVIEPVPARVDGQRIDGREMTPRIERFTLQKQGANCVLLREGNPEPVPLPGAHCRAL